MTVPIAGTLIVGNLVKELILYSTLGCHLCELAKEQIEPLLDSLSLTIVEIDIANDDDLLERYGVRIPVIKTRDSINDLGWPFDTHQVHAFLSNIQS